MNAFPPIDVSGLTRELAATDRLVLAYVSRGEVPPASLINWRVALRIQLRRAERRPTTNLMITQ